MPNFISEDQIEQALVQKLQHLHGFDALDCYTTEAEDLNDGSNRAKRWRFRLLDDAIEQGLVFCHEKEVALREVLGGDDVFNKLGRFKSFADTLLTNDEWCKAFNVYENTISSLYEACKPEIMGRGKQS